MFGRLGKPCVAIIPGAILPWIGRLALNYKGLAFKIEWIEGPDIEPVSLKYGAAPTGMHPDGHPKYTVPMIYDPNTETAIADSAAIARYLDKTYPSTPTLFPVGSDALQMAFLDFISTTVYKSLEPILNPQTVGMNPATVELFMKRYPHRVSRSPEDIVRETPEHLKALEGYFGTIGKWLDTNGQGNNVFMMGNAISFADLQTAAILVCLRNTCGEESEEWRGVMTWHEGRWEKFLEHFIPYTAVDNP